MSPTDRAQAEEWKMLFDLRGKWKFEIGDDLRRAEAGYDDSKWESILAPSAWEYEGYPGYDGYAWYRKHFVSSGEWIDKSLVIRLGVIDDVDEVYLNGHLIGHTGDFPPDYHTAYDVDRAYAIPEEFLSASGDNVVAVRVYDQELSGGILRGKLGVYEDLDAIHIDVPLATRWKFNIGDNREWSAVSFDDRKWEDMKVPSFWESEGHKDYDGFAWYRVKFHLPEEFQGKRLILLLGKIDDFDETFVNGDRIGHTGTMETRTKDIPGSDAYQQLRAYMIPPDYLNPSGENTVAVRVYDGYRDGGIYAGPIGIVTRESYMKWNDRLRREKMDFFEWLFR